VVWTERVVAPLLPEMVDGEKVKITPGGNALLESATGEEKPLAAVELICVLALPPAITFRVGAAAFRLKLGGDVTVSERGAVRVTPPPLAFTVSE